MPHTSRAHRPSHLLLVALSCPLLAATTAHAQETSPYYIGVSQSFTRDSNIHRTATNEVSETISSTGVLLGINEQLSRQRLFADASAQVNRYSNVDTLNNKSYALTAGLDWETVEFLSGRVRYSTRNSLTNVGQADGSTISGDQVTNEFDTSVRIGLTSYLALEGGFEHHKLDYKNPVLDNRDYSQNAVNGGVRWKVGETLNVGLGYRSTKGETPEFQQTPPFADELKRRDVDLTAIWTPTPLSTLNARISATKETHSLAPNAELSETTGALTWDYRPTPKLSVSVSASRDTGLETSFLPTAETSAPILPVDTSRISKSFGLTTRYLLTAKTSMRAEIQQRNGSLSDGTEDKVRSYTVGANFSATRSLSFDCRASRETRDVSGGRAYLATVYGCSGEFTLR